MQPRLRRSTTERIIGGVCGGLGDYFAIDPVIVRLIFVLVTVSSGMGLPVYIVLWVLMPRSSEVALRQNHPAHAAPEASQRMSAQLEQQSAHHVRVAQAERQMQHQRIAQSGSFQQGAPTQMPYQQPPVQPAINELSGMHDIAATGPTVRLPAEDAPDRSMALPPIAERVAEHPRRCRNWRTLGYILLGIGGLVLIEQVTASGAFLFPVLLIALGIFLLLRGRR